MKSESFIYRQMNAEDILDASNMVARVFNESIAPEYSPDGVREFCRYIEPGAFRVRSQSNHICLIALAQTRIVGLIELRGYDHISLLFVAQDYRRRGIARELLIQVMKICQGNEPKLLEISVNSSSFAVSIYEKLGFYRVGEKQFRNGMGFIPMVLKLPNQTRV